MQFNELSLSEGILRAVSELGFENATEIQSKAIPAILEKRDVVGLSSTGTGKTAAFGIPVLEMASTNTNKASVLILSPTRELALQIADELRKFSKYLSNVPTAVLYGGAPMPPQITQLKTARIVIGTPGRVMDHLRRRTLKLDNLSTIVLDEADEMLNMGFIDDINTILESAPEQRQTVLFSATMPSAIKKITREYQTDPITIKVDVGQKTAATIVQSYYNIPQSSKQDALKLLIEYHKPVRSLVFCNTKKMVDELCENLCSSGFRAVALHGDLKQTQRTSVMREFKTGRANILIATDVAARGIDVDDVEAVLNYDIPQEYEYYIHRIGRTGRAGKAGASYTLVANRSQLVRLREIERYIGAPITEQPVPTIESILANKQHRFAEDVRAMVQNGDGEEWNGLIEKLVEEGFSANAIAAALCSKLQRKSSRLASVRNVISASSGKSRHVQAAGKGRCWLRATIGSNAKIGPNFIVGAIVEASGLPKTAVGKINIYADYTDVDIAQGDSKHILDSMQGVRIKGQDVKYTLTSESGRGASSGNDRFSSKKGSGRSRFSDKGRNGNGFYGKKQGGKRHG